MITHGPYKGMGHPFMLYKKPGPHKMMGGMYDCLVVDKCDEKAFDTALKDGWKDIFQIQGLKPSVEPVQIETDEKTDDPVAAARKKRAGGF
jgi:hypothetical protein